MTSRLQLRTLLLTIAITSLPVALWLNELKRRERAMCACFVMGDVRAPARFPFRSDLYVADAIQAAGGLNATADRKKALVVRRARRGEVRTLPVRFEECTGRVIRETNYRLLPDDRLVIFRSADFRTKSLSGAKSRASANVYPMRKRTTATVQ
jgi:protein involved in polysaccharide export with SLBB domain